ncbi:MAG: hypothetical protein ACRDSS_12815, partial [Actinocrinis sp.]
MQHAQRAADTVGIELAGLTAPLRYANWNSEGNNPVALKRVCDITGTDVGVEICDVTIAGQTIKLDLAPAGVERLKEFFGPMVSVRHPHESPDFAAGAESAAAETVGEDGDVEASVDEAVEIADDEESEDRASA